MIYYFVYILQLANKQLYVGRTSRLPERLHEHQSGKSNFTSRRLPVKLLYYEAFINKSDAIKRERYLKTSKVKYTLKAMLRKTLSV